MARSYRKPELCNYYCSNQCDIGKKHELEDFAKIKIQQEQLAMTVEGLRLWCSKSIANGNIDNDKFEELCNALRRK